MKRLISALLFMAVLCLVYPGSALTREQIDAAFNAGSLKLVESDTGHITLSVADLHLTDEVIKAYRQMSYEEDIHSVLEAAVAEQQIDLMSLSPAGNSALLAVGNIGVCRYDGEYHILHPSLSKGLEDINGNLTTYFSKHSYDIHYMIDSDGVTYSPDGRYAAINNRKMLFYQSLCMVDPVVIDLSTGEMIITGTSLQTLENGGDAVAASVFSADSRFYYYILYGYFGDTKVHRRFCRYDLISGETEICLETKERAFWPRLYQNADGNFMIINVMTHNPDRTGGIIRYENHNGKWSTTRWDSELPVKYLYPCQLLYSARSGYAVTINKGMGNGAHTFHIFRPDDDFNGFGLCYCISEKTDEVLAISPRAFKTVEEDIAANVSNEYKIVTSDAYPYQSIMEAVMSPDGSYLLVRAVSTPEEKSGSIWNLYLIRLDDLAIRKVEGLDAREDIMIGPLAAKFNPVIEWNTDDLIIITKDGIRTFRFE